jgi:PAS domain S-box-containing protein
MGILNFLSANCKSCYKCLRACPVKAIRFKDEQAQIDEDRCIGCGTCFYTCPQNARNIKSDIDLVKEAIKEGRDVVVSIAPSFPAEFHEINPFKVPAALKKLGIKYVEETAFGAEIVSNLYSNYIKSSSEDVYITTACPSVNLFIQKYFPSITKFMLPFVSPMIAHSRVIRKKYNNPFVVFIGPCIGKKLEKEDFQTEDAIDAVLTFDEMTHWLKEEEIDFNSLEPESFDTDASLRGKIFPFSGGILKGLKNQDCMNEYEIISVDGEEMCRDTFTSIENGELKKVIVEANFCKGGCIGGPCLRNNQGIFTKKLEVKDYAKDAVYEISDKKIFDIDFTKYYFDRSLKPLNPSEEDIKNILSSMGKFSEKDELNCGVCGYNTCKEKAMAIYAGMAEPSMCLKYMRDKAESMSNITIENSLNGIIMIDEDTMIKEFNPAAEMIFNCKFEDVKDNPISLFMEPEDFYHVLDTKENILNKKVILKDQNKVIVENLIYIEKQKMVLTILQDVTEVEKGKEKLKEVKMETLDAAQKVIEKQMTTAQEIASLLGETTAETKVILTKLKNIALSEDDI